MKTRKRPLIYLATASLSAALAGALIPGNSASQNGFDGDGDGEVCWLGRSANDLNDALVNIYGNVQPIHNPLISNFSIVGNVQLYPMCPSGTTLDVLAPLDFGEFGAVTQHNYSFVVNGTLDLREWPSDLIVTDGGNALEAVVHVSLECVSNDDGALVAGELNLDSRLPSLPYLCVDCTV